MNTYTYEELTIAHKEEFSVTITKSMMESFKAITGDINPLHTDIEYAKQKGFDNNVVYGMLSASFLSTLAGVYLPGEKSLIQSVETKFLKPVFVGDTLTIRGEISEMNDTFKIIRLKVLVINQDNIKVLKGNMQIGIV